jgi:hypothetical protein
MHQIDYIKDKAMDQEKHVQKRTNILSPRPGQSELDQRSELQKVFDEFKDQI